MRYSFFDSSAHKLT